MTKDEAIEILKYNSNVIHQTINGETDPKEVEALDMSIKALEKLQWIEDLINDLSIGDTDTYNFIERIMEND